MLADVRSLCGAVGERDGALECFAGFGVTTGVAEQCATHAVKIEIAVEWLRERLEHLERGFGAPELRDRDRAIQRNDWLRLHGFERGVEAIDRLPVGVGEARRARVHG